MGNRPAKGTPSAGRQPNFDEEIEEDAASFSPAVFDQADRLQVPPSPNFPHLHCGQPPIRNNTHMISLSLLMAASALMRPPPDMFAHSLSWNSEQHAVTPSAMTLVHAATHQFQVTLVIMLLRPVALQLAHYVSTVPFIVHSRRKTLPLHRHQHTVLRVRWYALSSCQPPIAKKGLWQSLSTSVATQQEVEEAVSAVTLTPQPSLGFADCSQVEMLDLPYKFVNFGAEECPDAPNFI